MFKSALRVRENTFICHIFDTQNEHPHQTRYHTKIRQKYAYISATLQDQKIKLKDVAKLFAFLNKTRKLT